MDELSELLISKVRSHPYLYDDQHKEYKNLNAKEQAWKKIGEDLKMSPMKVKSRWKNLRDSYVKYKNQLNKVTDAAGQEAVNNRFIKWAGRAYLSFLDETLARRTQSISTRQVPLKEENTPTSPIPKLGKNLPHDKEKKKVKQNSSRLKRKSQNKLRRSINPYTTSPKRGTKHESVYKNVQQVMNDTPSEIFSNEIGLPENCLEITTTNGIAGKEANMLGATNQNSKPNEADMLHYLEDKRRCTNVGGGGGVGGGGDAIDHLFSSYAQTFRTLPLRQQVNIKIEMAKIFAIAEIESQP